MRGVPLRALPRADRALCGELATEAASRSSRLTAPGRYARQKPAGCSSNIVKVRVLSSAPARQARRTGRSDNQPNLQHLDRQSRQPSPCATNVRRNRRNQRPSPAPQKARMPPTTTGTIKRITDKGFGFIAAHGRHRVFFHQSACTSTPFDSMREGEQVTFTVGQGPKGPRAENIRPAVRGGRLRPDCDDPASCGCISRSGLRLRVAYQHMESEG